MASFFKIHRYLVFTGNIQYPPGTHSVFYKWNTAIFTPRPLFFATMTSSSEVVSTPIKKSGVKTILRYTGIPPSWLDKRPKLPSRNWLIFLSVTSTALGCYIYDRRQCKKIRQEYIDKVKHFSEVSEDPFETPRRVKVYGARWPGDEDYDQSLRYFRKYVKVCAPNFHSYSYLFMRNKIYSLSSSQLRLTMTSYLESVMVTSRDT